MAVRPTTSLRKCAQVLLIDPCEDTRLTLGQALARNGLSCVEERDGISAWNRFLAEEPVAVVAALDLPGLPGWELLARVRGRATTPFVFHSTTNDASTAVSAIQAGADDFIVLPDDIPTAPDRIQALIERHLGLSIRSKVESLVVGRSAAIARVREKLRGLAGLRIPVLVRGEEGAGRDHVVTALAAIDDERGIELVVVRPATPRGPGRQDAGKIVYLDSIDRFPLAQQHQWSAQMEQAHAERADAPKRILASTAADLLSLASTGNVDAALAARLTHFTVDLPPLRDRREDIPLLARHLAGRVAERMGRNRVMVTDPAVQMLRRQTWPGNVRELEAIVERLVAYSRDGRITRANVTAVFQENPSSVMSLRLSEEKRQREELTELLAATGGNLAEVGRRLGMSRGAVIYRAQKFGLLPKRRGHAR